MERQMDLSDFIQLGKEDNYPEWRKYVRTADNKEVKAYSCNDKEWYVIKSLEHDHYWMEQKRAFETSYSLEG